MSINCIFDGISSSLYLYLLTKLFVIISQESGDEEGDDEDEGDSSSESSSSDSSDDGSLSIRQ